MKKRMRIVTIVYIWLCGIYASPNHNRDSMEKNTSNIPQKQNFYIKGNYQQLKDYIYDGKTISLSEEEWKRILSLYQYRIIRKKGTEPPFTGKYYHNHQKGIYVCAACGLPLFLSSYKYDSGSGWPSFYMAIQKQNEKPRIREKIDTSYGMIRTEIVCGRCGAHLGHVFPDGPPPTRLRYCVNSISLNFISENP